jgi:hypothetical protein
MRGEILAINAPRKRILARDVPVYRDDNRRILQVISC